MSTWVLLLLIVAAAAVPYLLWSRYEARKQARAAASHAHVEKLGDEVIPLSLHPEVNLDECIGSGACVRACPEKEILAITDGRARLINPLSCIGHSACMQACPVSAIKLIYGTAARGVELPKLTPTFETNQAGIYVIGELSGMGLIRNAVEQGRQVAGTIAKSGRRGDRHDAIVVGAGPAGIAAALGLAAHGLRAVIVEQDRYGGTIQHYPRAKVVMTGAFELPGYGTVRSKTMSKEQLLDLWRDIRARTKLAVEEGIRVEAIAPERDGWAVNGANAWKQHAPTVVLALGRRGAPRQLGVPGEDLPNVQYRLLEPGVFAGQRVMVVGGGNAAADCVIALAEAGVCSSIAISYRRSELSRLRGSVRSKIDRFVRDGAITTHFDSEVAAIATDHVRLKTARGHVDVGNDQVIVQIGGQSPSDLLRTIGIELVEKRGVAGETRRLCNCTKVAQPGAAMSSAQTSEHRSPDRGGSARVRG